MKTPEDVINRFINEENVKFNQERDDWMIEAMEEYAKLYHESEVKKLNIPVVSGSLPDAEIITWLRKQNYQTEMGEQEYRMYFDVDMPKIIRAAIAHFSSGNER